MLLHHVLTVIGQKAVGVYLKLALNL